MSRLRRNGVTDSARNVWHGQKDDMQCLRRKVEGQKFNFKSSHRESDTSDCVLGTLLASIALIGGAAGVVAGAVIATGLIALISYASYLQTAFEKEE